VGDTISWTVQSVQVNHLGFGITWLSSHNKTACSIKLNRLNNAHNVPTRHSISETQLDGMTITCY